MHDSAVVQAPPVVGVVVVHEPGSWFDETLDSFARQDYPNLRLLFLVTRSNPDADRQRQWRDRPATWIDQLAARITAKLPAAFVRRVDGNPGFGAVANEVLRLVEGEHGLFLICHDDVALEPDAPAADGRRALPFERRAWWARRSWPWDDARVLESVGLGVDRFGEVDRTIELGEVDQEQHDGVRDVFVLPSACMLVRADLFRELGGFDEAIVVPRRGRRTVLANPSQRCPRRGRPIRHGCVTEPASSTRRPDLHHERLKAQHRMRTVATLTGGSRLPGRSLEMVLLTAAELIVGVFTATFGQAWASLRALVGLIPRTPSVLARRRAVKPFRRVPEREVAGLQTRGSARLVVVPAQPRHRDLRVRRRHGAPLEGRHDRTGRSPGSA